MGQWEVTLSFKFGANSQRRLHSCNLQLQLLFKEVIKYRDCSVLCGHRDKTAQDAAYPEYSHVQWPDSTHNTYPSLAVDVVPYPVNWDDIKAFHEFSGFVMGVAATMDIKIRWGGHFNGFFDGPHYELIQ